MLDQAKPNIIIILGEYYQAYKNNHSGDYLCVFAQDEAKVHHNLESIFEVTLDDKIEYNHIDGKKILLYKIPCTDDFSIKLWREYSVTYVSSVEAAVNANKVVMNDYMAKIQQENQQTEATSEELQISTDKEEILAETDFSENFA